MRKILGTGEQPVPMPEEVISYLQQRVSERGYIVPGPCSCRVCRRAFATLPHLKGIIERLASASERVRVLLLLHNRSVSVEVNCSELERV